MDAFFGHEQENRSHQIHSTISFSIVHFLRGKMIAASPGAVEFEAYLIALKYK